METIGITLAIVSDAFFYPWFISARLGAFFLAFALFVNFWFDQKIAVKRMKCKLVKNEKDESLKRVCEFL